MNSEISGEESKSLSILNIDENSTSSIDNVIINEDTRAPIFDDEISIPNANVRFQRERDREFQEDLEAIRNLLSDDQIQRFLTFAEEWKDIDQLKVVDFLQRLCEESMNKTQ